MPFLIDGYNLIHAANIVGRGRGPGHLERARLALLNFLVESLTEAELAGSVVVFDAADAPPGLPSTLKHRGITVRFARGDGDADALLEELILADSSPRRLMVVSSDHRVQRAAKRRRAQAMDSDVWYAEIIRRRAEQPHSDTSASTAKPPPPATESEVEFWLKHFSVDAPRGDADNETIFPPGYAEDEEG